MTIVKILMILTVAVFVLFPMSLYAGQIGTGGFVSPSIFDYNGLGLPLHNVTPIVIGGNTYTTEDTTVRYSAFGAPLCVDGECIGSENDIGYIDIVLATPALRAGGWVGNSSANVQFFNESDVLLGTVSVTPTVSMEFAGWQADSGLIKRIRISDTQINGVIVTFDNLTLELGPPATSVPTMNEWGMIIFLMLAGLGSVFYLSRQRTKA